jgi:hypothetical protein
MLPACFSMFVETLRKVASCLLQQRQGSSLFKTAWCLLHRQLTKAKELRQTTGVLEWQASSVATGQGEIKFLYRTKKNLWNSGCVTFGTYCIMFQLWCGCQYFLFNLSASDVMTADITVMPTLRQCKMRCTENWAGSFTKCTYNTSCGQHRVMTLPFFFEKGIGTSPHALEWDWQ